MKAIPMTSTFISGAAYDETKQTLRIRIEDTFYYYLGVTRQKVARFKNAASKGSYFVKHIKGQYEVKRRKCNF